MNNTSENTNNEKTSNANKVLVEKMITNHQIEKINDGMKQIDEAVNKIIKQKENKEFDPLDIVDDRLKSYTLEEVKKLSIEEITSIFTIDGELIEFDGDFSNTDKNQFMKDLIVYLKEVQINKEEMDNMMKEYKEDVKKFNAELDELLKGYEDLPAMYAYNLEECKKNATEQKVIDIYDKKIKILNYGYTMENVIKFYNEIGTKNTLREYSTESLRKQIISKYDKKIKQIGLKVSIAAFNNYEQKFLDGDYKKRNNLFIFSIMKYIANKTNLNIKSPEITFVVYLALILQCLYADSLSESHKEQFINSSKKLLDLF